MLPFKQIVRLKEKVRIMEILESLNDILESATTDEAIAAMKRTMDRYGVYDGLLDEIISLEMINDLVRERLDSDDLYGWAHAQDLLSEIESSDATWYEYIDGTLKNLSADAIDGYVDVLVRYLQPDLLEAIQEAFDEIYDTFCELSYFYEEMGNLSQAEAIEDLNAELSSISANEVPALTQRVESTLRKGLASSIPTDLSTNLSYALTIVKDLKDCQNFLR